MQNFLKGESPTLTQKKAFDVFRIARKYWNQAADHLLLPHIKHS